MIDSLEIKNYRRFKELKVHKLGMVNLIIGKNNTGKTSLLEALYIYANRGDLTAIDRMVKQRGEVVKNGDAEPFYSILNAFQSVYNSRYYDFEKSKSIVIGSLNKPENSYEFKPIMYKTEINESIASKMFEGKTSINLSEVLETFINVTNPKKFQKDTQIGFQIKFGKEKPVVKTLDGLSEIFSFFNKPNQKTLPCVFISSDSLTNARALELWENISLTDNETKITEIINLIDNSIERISFKGQNEKIPYLRIKGQKEPIAARSLGEGTTRLLNLAISLYNCSGGILLIDEFENGLHYSIQPSLFENLFLIAEKLKIQIFITTHSKDVLYSFIGNMEKYKNIPATIFRLTEFKNQIEAVEYDFDELVLVKNQYSDLR